MVTPLFHYLLIHWLIAFIPIALGIFVVSKNTKNPLYWAFLRYNFVISWWGAFTLFMEYSRTPAQALFWDRVSLLGIVFIPSAFLHFTWMYSGKSKYYDYGVKVCYLLSSFFFLFVFTPLMARSATQKYIIPYFTDPGFLYHLFVTFFTLVMTFGNFLVFRAWLKCPLPRQKQGILLFLIATSISTLGGGGNFLVPYNIYVPILYPYGGYTFIFYGLLITYTVLRHKFLDIEVIIKKTLVFAGIVAAAVCAISLPVGLIQLIIGRQIGISPFWLMISGIATTALIYRPLEQRLINLTDKYLFQKKYDYKKLLQDASRGISQIKSLSHLLKLVTHFITMRMRLKNAAVLIYDKKNRFFQFAYPRGYPKNGWLREGHVFPEDKSIIRYLLSKRKPLTLEQIKERTEAKTNGQENFQILKQEMEELSTSCLIPSFLGDSCQGILILGDKKSDEPFTDDDLALLYAIAQESAVAMENARLYDEAVEHAIELEKNYKELESAKTDLMRAFRQSEDLRKREEALKEEALADKKKIQEMGAQLIERERNRVLGNMAGGLAHELRHPFSYVENSVYFIKKLLTTLQQDRAKLSEEKWKEIFEKFLNYVNTIKMANDREIAIVKTVEAFSRRKEIDYRNLDFSDENLEFMGLDFKTLVGFVSEESRFVHESRNTFFVDLVTDAPRDLPLIRASRDHLIELFINLLTNAYDAMRESREKKIILKAYLLPNEPNFLQIEFQDTGCGIPDSLKDKVWEYSFTTKRHEGGSGIGLFWCKLAVENIHKGKIWFESKEGKGTTFFVKLPVWKDGMQK